MLRPGQHVGPYEVRDPIGAGGMGEVYRAHDLRLKRDVALKVLPEKHRLTASRRERLEREAQALAGLSHAHIATLYGIEDVDGAPVLVMELIEGQTLAQLLSSETSTIGPARRLPVKRALAIAIQIGEALAVAHDRGILHRDLKPGNVMIRPDGSVKVLDFGLVKVLDDEAAPETPTLTASSLDFIIGTPAYASPEQAKGLRVDRRTDIWSFGCVLYEMLTGHRAFEGNSVSEVVARVLERNVDFSLLPADTPPAVRRLLPRLLAKDPADRLRDIADACLELKDATTADAPGHVEWRSRSMKRWGLAAAAALVLAIAALVVGPFARSPRHTPSRTVRFELQFPASAPLLDGGIRTRLFAIAPDGSKVAYMTNRGIAIRALDRLDVDVIEVRDINGLPFFSPDGRWVGGTGDGGIRMVAIEGGASTVIVPAREGAIGTWGDDGVYFADIRGLFHVADPGSEPKPLRIPSLGQNEQITLPEWVKGHHAVLYTVVPTRSNALTDAAVSATARIEALDLDTGKTTVVLRGGGHARYLPDGHLLYVADRTVMLARFDAARLQIIGPALPLQADATDYAVSNEATLAYGTGLSRSANQLVWVDRNGREEALETPPGPYTYPRLSPDGTRIALDVVGDNRDAWVWDIRRRSLDRLTFDPTENVLPNWSPDGKRIVFSSSLSGTSNIYWQAVDSDTPERLTESANLQQPLGFAPDGRLLVSEIVPGHGRDIVAVTVDGSRRHETLVGSSAMDANADVSPDGRWLAYESNESGQFEVYVRPYPQPGSGRWKVSTNGGRQPLWSPDSGTLYFRDFAGAVMSITVARGPQFTAAPPDVVIPGSRTYTGFGAAISGRTYDLSLDGTRFLMVKIPSEVRTPSLVVVQNWLTEAAAQLH